MTIKFNNIIAALIVGVALISACIPSVTIESVKTENGIISGILGTDPSVKVFKGIPYAAPPIGDLRWKEPQPVANWEGIRKCDVFGPNAIQGKPVPFMVWTSEFLIPEDGEIKEDCLYLNVWTSAKQANEKRPVIVYIHGGGFVSGGGSVPIYDGEAMAKKGIVFVTINYRLGIFGFYSHPELTKESSYHASGNYGILDQIAALQWVQKNISAFGGDPDNVTIAGQSAGSMSVNVLQASPLTHGLYAKVIGESGASVVPMGIARTVSLDSAHGSGLQFQKLVGANSLEELRQMPADKLFGSFRGFGLVIVDGYVLPEPISKIFAEGKQNKVPLLTGYNGDDVLFAQAPDFATYQENIKNQFGTNANDIMQNYPATNDEETIAAAHNLSRDMTFGIQNFSWALVQSKQSIPSYLYFFDRKVPIKNDATNYGAFHTGEVSYAYDNLKFLDRPLEDADHQLAELMSAYWVNFARNGDPNGEGLPHWPAFTAAEGQTMVFNSTSEAKQHPYFDGLQVLYKHAVGK